MPPPVSTDPLRWPRLWRTGFVLAQGILLLLSLLPLPSVQPPVEHWDKWGHVLAHLALAAIAVLVFRTPRGRWLALGWLVLFGVLIEALQGLLPWRSMEAADLLANLAGTALGGLLALTRQRDALLWLEGRWGAGSPRDA